MTKFTTLILVLVIHFIPQTAKTQWHVGMSALAETGTWNGSSTIWYEGCFNYGIEATFGQQQQVRVAAVPGLFVESNITKSLSIRCQLQYVSEIYQDRIGMGVVPSLVHLPSGEDTIIVADVARVFETTFRRYDAVLSLQYYPSSAFSVQIGAGVCYLLSFYQSYGATETSVQYPNLPVFATSSNVRPFYPLAVVGASYSFDLWRQLSLAACVQYKVCLTSIVPKDLQVQDFDGSTTIVGMSNCSYSFQSVSAGLELRYQL